MANGRYQNLTALAGAMGLSVSLSGQYRFSVRGGLVGVGLAAGAHARSKAGPDEPEAKH